jgi:hypothetical protein
MRPESGETVAVVGPMPLKELFHRVAVPVAVPVAGPPGPPTIKLEGLLALA